MTSYTTIIDTVKVQSDFSTQEKQHMIHAELITYIRKHYFIKYKDFNNEITGQMNRVFFVYYKDTYICSISTGIYTTLDKKKQIINHFYISIKSAGLIRYKKEIDQVSNDCFFRLCAFLNTRDIPFRITQLDIAIDLYTKFNNVLTVCTKRTANTQYYTLTEEQKFAKTRYVEKVSTDRLYKVSKHAYTYDKTYKERLNFDVTRFELSLGAKFFNKHGVDINIIAQTLDRYHVMYFPTLKEKNTKINEYESYANFRARDVKRIGFEQYRIYPNLEAINVFLFWMYKITLFDYEKYAVIS